jgi:tripartite motif-containing protein 37
MYNMKNDLTFNLEELTKCYICLGKIVEATMCPSCQKLSCHKCIQV